MKGRIWMPIPGYESYLISSLGEVQSLITNKILKNQNGPDGYKIVCLSKSGIVATKRIHKLVAIAFLGHKPNKHHSVIDHIDNDRHNNNLLNLRIVSQRENCSKKSRKYSSAYTGVSWCNTFHKWRSRIQINGKNVFLGYFKKEEDAADAYTNKLKQL